MNRELMVASKRDADSLRVHFMPEVFISYSSKDQAAAEAALAALEGRGISCWIARQNISPGREWGEALMEGIESCRVFLLLFSENANQSPQVRREVERAVHKGLIVVPVRLEDRLPQKSLEYFISAAHWMDAFPEPFEAYLESLAKAVESLCGSGRAETDAPMTPSTSSRLPVLPAPTLVSDRKARGGIGVAGWLAVMLAVGIVAGLGGWVSTKLRPNVPVVPPPEVIPPDGGEVVSDLKLKVEMVPMPTSGVLVISGREPESHYIRQKMKQIVLPVLPFNQATLEEAVEFVRIKSRELDANEANPARKGINIILRGVEASLSMTMELRDVTLEDALNQITSATNTKYVVEDYAVLIVPTWDQGGVLVTREYPFAAELLSMAKSEFRNGGAQVGFPDPFATEPQSPGIRVFSLKDWLASNGVSFPPGSSVVSMEQKETVVVRTTDENHALVGALIDSLYAMQPDLKRPLIERSRVVP